MKNLESYRTITYYEPYCQINIYLDKNEYDTYDFIINIKYEFRGMKRTVRFYATSNEIPAIFGCELTGVENEVRGLGLGTLALNSFLWAAKNNMPSYSPIEIFATTDSAQEFYEKHGFIFDGDNGCVTVGESTIRTCDLEDRLKRTNKRVLGKHPVNIK